MWTENVDDANMDTQVWPRAAAAAGKSESKSKIEGSISLYCWHLA